MNSISQHERTSALIGVEGFHILQKSHVLVAGLGGVGSFVIEALARAGIGQLSLIDGDIIEASNINRQLLALHNTIGRTKVEVAYERLKLINPNCDIQIHNIWLTPENITTYLACEPDWVIDCIDDLPAKTALLATAYKMRTPVLSVLGTANRKQAFAGFQLTDISKTSVCPLARSLRQRLRKLGISAGIPVIFSPHASYRASEIPLVSMAIEETKVSEANNAQARTLGSISYLPGQAGLLAAGTVIERLLEQRD